MIMTSEQAHEVLERTLAFGSAEHLEISLSGSTQGSTRYANNAITQNQARSDATLQVRAAFGQRLGQAQTNQFDEEALQQVVERAQELARRAEPDPEYLPPPGPQEYARVQAFDEATASCSPGERAAAIAQVTTRCRQAGLRAAGSFTTQASFNALLNSSGLHAYHRRTQAQFAVTALTEDSSGKAEAVHTAAHQLDAGATAEAAMEKAERGRQPRDLEPGDYPVILEPAAAAGLLAFLAWNLDAKAAREGRSPFSGREGEDLLHREFTLSSRPVCPACPGDPMLADGMPAPALEWFSRGRLRTLAYDRYRAQESQRPFTGRPTNIVMEEGDSTLEELIAGCQRGLLVTRFWYIRYIDPMRLLLTGMTRDGLFWIEDGAVRHGVKNLRFNDSPLRVFRHIEALGPAQRVGDYTPMWVPAVRLASFHFDSGTSF